jgi:DNA polymerase III subunit beta
MSKASTWQAGRSRAKFESLQDEDFPDPLAPKGEIAEIPLNDANHRRILKTPKSAISDDGTRRHLEGIFISVSGDQATAVACDGHRLTRGLASVAATGEWRSIIVAKSAIEIMTALGGNRLITDGRIVQMISEETTFASKVIDETYPDWKRVVPQKSQNTVEFNIADLLSALARIKAVAIGDGVDKHRTCGLKWCTGDSLTLLLRDDAAEEIVAALAVGECILAVAIDYLIDALEALDAERAVIDCADCGSQIRITAPGDDGVLGIVMPRRW